MVRRLLLFALWLAIATAVEDAACYDPEGNFAPGYFPCNPTAFITSCCPAGYGCYSNSLCVVVEGNVAQPNLTVGSVRRAMCTNPEWTSEICGKFCLDDKNNTHGDMGWCEGTTFCCQGALNAGDCDCSTGDGIVDPGQGKPNTVIQEGFQPPSSPTYLPAKKESSTQTPTSTSAAPTPKPSSGGGGSGGEDKGGDGNGQGGSTGLSTAAKAGIGVGATVAAILAVAAGVYFCKGGSDGRNVAPHFTD